MVYLLTAKSETKSFRLFNSNFGVCNDLSLILGSDSQDADKG